MHTFSKNELYKRQTTLSEVGQLGQEKLLQTKVLVIGCGGLGNAAAVYLAASGVGELHLVDFDTVSVSNLHRQVFYSPDDVGKQKTAVLARYISSIAPHIKLELNNTGITKENAFGLVEKTDFVLDCTDHLPTKYLINDVCVLSKKPLIYGSLYKFDGYVASFNLQETNQKFSCNLRDAFPELPKEQVPNCAEVGTMNTIVGIIGLMQANELIKLATGIGTPLKNTLLIFNSLDNSQFNMTLQKRFDNNSLRGIFEKTTYTDAYCETQDARLLISAEKLKEKITDGKAKNHLQIISVIEDLTTVLPFDVQAKIPLSELVEEDLHFKEQDEVVVICNRGISSYEATKRIQQQFPNLRVKSLEGGITGYGC